QRHARVPCLDAPDSPALQQPVDPRLPTWNSEEPEKSAEFHRVAQRRTPQRILCGSAPPWLCAKRNSHVQSMALTNGALPWLCAKRNSHVQSMALTNGA